MAWACAIYCRSYRADTIAALAGTGMIGQPPLPAVVFFGVLMVGGLLAMFAALVIVDRRRPAWRDRLTVLGISVAAAVLIFATYSFLMSSPESADFAVVPATATGALLLGALVWWLGHGRPLALLSIGAAVVLALVLANPGFWMFNDLRMLWIAALLAALAVTGTMGRRGRARPSS